MDAAGNHRPLLLNATVWLATNSALSVNDLAKYDTDLEIYPNPSSDYIFIKSNKNNSSNYVVNLSDAAGKLMFSKAVNSNKIDIKSLAKGIYFLTIKTERRIKSFKIVKK